MIIGFTIISCKNDIIYYDDDRIWIEDLTKNQIYTTVNKYNYDNLILLPNVECIYDYYQLRQGKKVKFSAGGGEYIDYDSPDNSTIMEFGMQTLETHH